MTLNQLVSGGTTIAQANSKKSWITPAETELVLSFMEEMGDHGFSLSHRRLKEHVDLILHACLGDKFPKQGVRKNWTAQFADLHSDRIKRTSSCPLEDKRGHTTNPHNNKAWFDLLETTIKEHDIQPENTYGVDKIGIQGRGNEQEVVFGRKKRGPQYQAHAGTRENTTVLATICADGLFYPSAVFFKGGAYQVKWLQNNPLNAS